MALSRTRSAAVFGIDAHFIDVEVDMYPGAGRDFITVGMPDLAVRESRERIKSAMLNSGFGYPNKSVTINLAPANLKKEGAGFDLPMAVGILGAMGVVTPPDDHLFIGELSLDGTLRPVRGALSIAVAGAREAELPEGETSSLVDQRRARRVLLVSSFILCGLLYFGKQWWNAEDAAAAARVYTAPRVSATLVGGNRLVLKTQEATYLSDLIPDHGHLVHLFLIRVTAMDLFLHLHPVVASNGELDAELPTMPAGRYQIFADVVHQSGFPATMLGELDLSDISGPSLGGDDCEWSGAPLSTAMDTTESPLPDGGRIVWERPQTPVKAGVPASFRFRVEDPNGNPASDLQPYMGMAGHAEFVRSDLSTFAHLHPAGSVSMAAVGLAQASLLGNLVQEQNAAPAAMAMAMPLSPEISFPYGFPRPGKYRIFVQIKRAGRIETGVFDAHVN